MYTNIAFLCDEHLVVEVVKSRPLWVKKSPTNDEKSPDTASKRAFLLDKSLVYVGSLAVNLLPKSSI